MNLDKVDIAELKGAISELNKSEVVEANEIAKIKTIGKGKEELFKLFAETVEKVPDDQTGNLPDKVVEFYMTHVNPIEDEPGESNESEGEENPKEEESEMKKPVEKKKEEKKPVPKAKKVEEKKPVKKTATPKKEEKKPVKKTEKKPVPKKEVKKDLFGYKIGSQANLIDEALLKGATVKEMVKACGSTESRVRSHLYTLTKLKGFKLTICDGKYTYKKAKK